MYMKISDLFTIEYPHTLVYTELQPDTKGINFVSSQGGNNGVVGRVSRVQGVKIYHLAKHVTFLSFVVYISVGGEKI